MRRYLLGGASPAERIDLENAYLAESTVFEELTEAENDLIDSYVRGKLPEQDKNEFERQYLTSPQRQARVQFASALIDISQEPRPAAVVHRFIPWRWFTFSQQTPKLRWGFALGAAAIILAIGWLKRRMITKFEHPYRHRKAAHTNHHFPGHRHRPARPREAKMPEAPKSPGRKHLNSPNSQ